MRMSKPSFADIIEKAREQENATPELEGEEIAIPENQNTSMFGASGKVVEEMVNLSIRVPKRLRMHWVAEAKRHDTSITAVITEALNAKFGSPG